MSDTSSTHDVGQQIDTGDRVTGILPDRAALEAILTQLSKQNIAIDQREIFEGSEGMALFKRSNTFYFSDGEDFALQEFIHAISHGHVVLVLKVDSEETGRQVASIAEAYGGTRFTYFNSIVTKRFN